MLNIAQIQGRLVQTPELKTTQNGISTTSFTVASARSYVRPGSERQTDFIDVVAWRNTAEFVCRHFQKGQEILLDGSLQTRTYTDKSGNKRKVTEIVANHVYFTAQERKEKQEFSQESPYEDDFSQISADYDDLPF